MINKRNLVIILPTIILVVLLNILYLSSLNQKLDELTNTQSQTQTELDTKNMKVEALTEQIDSMENTINNLEIALTESQLNCSQLKDDTRNLNSTISVLEINVELLEEAIDIIGTGELGTILKKYGEVVKELDELQHEYNQLLLDYNKLLAQQES